MVKKYLSREIHIVDKDGYEEVYPLHIIEISYNENGEILSYQIHKFDHEEPGVTYVDHPIYLRNPSLK